MGRREEIIAVAGRILEERGHEGLTMRALADELGIRAPSLYKHITDKRDLEISLMADGLQQQAEAFEKAVAEGGEPVAAIADAYRRWSLEHPHLYRLMTDQPLPRETLPEGTEERAVAPLLAAVSGDMDRARATWAFAHGMVSLELANRFPPDADLDAAWTIGLNGFTSVRNTTHAEGAPNRDE